MIQPETPEVIGLYPLGAGVTVTVEQYDSDGRTIRLDANVALPSVKALSQIVTLQKGCGGAILRLTAGAGFTLNSGATPDKTVGATGNGFASTGLQPTADTPRRVVNIGDYALVGPWVS